MPPKRSRTSTPPWGALLLGIGCMGFQATGQQWDQPTIPYQVDPDGSDDISDGSDVQAVRDAFSDWAAVECSGFTTEEQAWQGPGINQPDDRNMVFWVNRTEGWLDEERDTLALTFAWNRDGRTIVDADTAINGAYFEWTTNASVAQSGEALDVKTVVLHEVGHFLGLAHSEDAAAVMFATNNKLVQRTLTSDDEAGLCFIYGDPTAGDPGPGCEVNPDGTRKTGCLCERGSDCESGVCFDDRALLGRQYCVETCIQEAARPECPPGYVCEDTLGAGFQCLLPAPGSSSLCQLCDGPGQCATGLCVQANNVNQGRPYCSFACTPGTPSCPQGYECIRTQQAGTQVSVCAPLQGVCDPPNRGAHNQRPNLDGSCDPGHAPLRYAPNSESFCFQICNNPGQSCPGLTDAVCDPVDNLMNAFVCRTIRQPLERCFPEFCAPTPGNPNGALCFLVGDDPDSDSVCYDLCQTTADCGVNQQCLPTNDGLQACVPISNGFLELGEPCRSDLECLGDDVCRIRGEVRRCTRACPLQGDPASSCGPNFECIPSGAAGQGLCWPDNVSDGGGGGGGVCTCDENPSVCDPSCGCDPDCGPICVCDMTSGCDADCDCDSDCGSSCSHVRVAPKSQTSSPLIGVFSVLLIGLWRRHLRDRCKR